MTAPAPMVELILVMPDGNSTRYFAYADVAAANVRLTVDPVRGPAWRRIKGDTFNTIPEDPAQEQGRLLVAGANHIKELPLRSDTPTTVLSEANILLAGTLAGNSGALSAASAAQDPNTKKVQSGRVQKEFFHPNSLAAKSPLEIADPGAYALLAPYLNVAADIGGLSSLGDDGEINSYEENWEINQPSSG